MKKILAFLLFFGFLGNEIFSATKPTQDQKSSQGAMNKLLAPGPLIEGHKNLEHTGCLQCHVAGQGIPDKKCLVCHEDIQKAVDTQTSFHGLVDKQCFECHSDHKGRKFDSTLVDEKSFNHHDTGFDLSSAHKKVPCADCHTNTREKKFVNKKNPRFWGAPTDCKSCHLKDDVHFFDKKFANKDCSSCHSDESWKTNLHFDHNATAFPLLGKHEKIACADCHVVKDAQGKQSGKYHWKNFNKDNCVSCHKDPHGNHISAKFSSGECIKCHNQSEWKITQFPHEVTGFVLEGKHKEIDCVSCHKHPEKTEPVTKENLHWTGLKQQCSSCHEDYHGFKKQKSLKLGELLQCENCHGTKNWHEGITFNHSTQTQYPLTGMHLQTKCNACHKPLVEGNQGSFQQNQEKRQYHWKYFRGDKCESCHQTPHAKSFPSKLLNKPCVECHETSGWGQLEKMKYLNDFNHDTLTRFPLTGKHSAVQCNDCHIQKNKEVYKFPNQEKKFCESCHVNVHKEQFNAGFSKQSCAECHNTTSFAKDMLPFDHEKTKFPLTGKHHEIRTKCEMCHVKTQNLLATNPPKNAGKFKFSEPPKDMCLDCHQNVHVNQFKKQFSTQPCSSCHKTDSFSNIAAFDHHQTGYDLLGAHISVACEACHTPTQQFFPSPSKHHQGKFIFKDVKTKNCAACHQDPHKGKQGEFCSRCHTETKAWTSVGDFHKNFTLNGAHYMLRCEDCHIKDRRLAGMSENCEFCHRKDDKHMGSLPSCGGCHSQQTWEMVDFRHSLTHFPLLGAHRTIDCKECHANGNYSGTPDQCSMCHFQDANKAAFPNHKLAGFEDCSQCHNQFSFSGTKK